MAVKIAETFLLKLAVTFQSHTTVTNPSDMSFEGKDSFLLLTHDDNLISVLTFLSSY